MSFKKYLLEKPSYYVHITNLKAPVKGKDSAIEKKITDAFYKLQFEDAPEGVSIVKKYENEVSDKIKHVTLVFELQNSGNILKTPRTSGIIIQTSNSDKELK